MMRILPWLTAGVLGLGLAACGEAERSAPTAVAITESTSCALDGMLLAHFPGPKAQVHFEGSEFPEYFCDTVEMFSIYLRPEQARLVRAIYVQDMGKADWDTPRGHWIDARAAFYVVGADARGSMGATIASFAQQGEATHFSREHGGIVLRFDEVTPDMVVLDGGVLNDQKM